MEQATNLFSKGLLMDTNPMVLGNDTLTDALNATFITMNGNEVILQNDMGNRRVDGAFLPAGYLPVGMKEYGGIIYVAAYNPITNRSLIGSFPSPERNILPEEIGDGLGTEIDLSVKQEIISNGFYTIEEEDILFLASRSFLTPLTEDTSLHAGDKFTVYSEDLYKPYYWALKKYSTNVGINVGDTDDIEYAQEGDWELLSESDYNLYDDTDYDKKIIFGNSDISNFKNIEEIDGKEVIISPKNKKYTLALGVMNSQNEFVDITKSLVRWNDDKIIDTNGDSELIKFNKGYFIAKSKELGDYNTIEDENLAKTRLALPINTYSFKLVGPLYLKATLNTITNFNYFLEASKTNEGNVVISITGYIEYNCPDGAAIYDADSLLISPGNDYGYKSLEDNTKVGENFIGFDFAYYTSIVDENENNIKKYEILLGEKDSTSGITYYNPETNLYRVTIKKTYTISKPGGGFESDEINYYILVSDSSDYYLKDLSLKGKILLNLLNSGQLIVNNWRYLWNKIGSKTLNYSISAYPSSSEGTFKNLTLYYKDISDELNELMSKVLIEGQIGSGGYLDNLDISFLDENKMYICSLVYEEWLGNEKTSTLNIGNIDVEIDGNTVTIDTLKKLWILTTPFFNTWYYTTSDFSNINKVVIDYDFGSKVTVDNITYNEYEKSNKLPYSKTILSNEDCNLDLTIESKISLTSSYNKSNTIENIPEEILELDNIEKGVFKLVSYLYNWNIDSQLKLYNSNFTIDNDIEFTLTAPEDNTKAYLNIKLFPKGRFTFSNYLVRDIIKKITITNNNNEEIVYDNNDERINKKVIKNLDGSIEIQIIKELGFVFDLLKIELVLEDLGNGEYSGFFFNFDLEVPNSIITYENIELEKDINIELKVLSTEASGSGGLAPSWENESDLIPLLALIRNNKIELTSTFKQKARFKPSLNTLEFEVRNYLTSAQEALETIIDNELKAPLIEIDFYNDKSKSNFYVEKGNSDLATLIDRNADVTGNFSFQIGETHGKLNPTRTVNFSNDDGTYNDAYNNFCESINNILTNVNNNKDRIIIAGIGLDRSFNENIKEIEEIIFDSYLAYIIRIWLKYKNENNEDCWALLANYEYDNNNNTFSSLQNKLKLELEYDSIPSGTIGNVLNLYLSNAKYYYGKFNNTEEKVQLFTIDKNNYYYFEKVDIKVYLNYKFDYSEIELINKFQIDNEIPKIPIFELSKSKIEGTCDFDLSSSELINNESFINDIDNFLNIYKIDYWFKNEQLNAQSILSNLNSENTLFLIVNREITGLWNLKYLKTDVNNLNYWPSLKVKKISERNFDYIYLQDLTYYGKNNPMLIYDCPQIDLNNGTGN